jgi:hypothetical protein
MIILIPLPLFFASTVYSVAGLSGKSNDIAVPVYCIQLILPRLFLYSLGRGGNDLGVLLFVYRGLVPAVGI